MARVPISFTQFTQTTGLGKKLVKYLVRIENKNSSWDQVFECDRKDLERLLKDLDNVLGESSLSELLGIPEEQATIIEAAHRDDPLCQGCKFKGTWRCVPCLIEIQSPIERILFLELSKAGIDFKIQFGISHYGNSLNVKKRSYEDPIHNFKDVLTVADFYIRVRDAQLCVYTDGHTYHERTEEQALKDRSQDRKLQQLGFTVFRYPGKAVRENPSKIVQEIKEWIAKAYE